jgi:phage terminase Nu1 subunit (DNA packaging protein)
VTTTFSLVAAAAALDVHRSTLDGWLKRGCPAAQKADRSRGIDWQLSLGDVMQWRIDEAVKAATPDGDDGNGSKDEADRRKAWAQARLAEIEVDTQLRNVAEVSHFKELATDMCFMLRAGIENTSAKIAGRACIMTDPNEIREMCRSEFNRTWMAAQSDWNERFGAFVEGTEFDPDNEEDDSIEY